MKNTEIFILAISASLVIKFCLLVMHVVNQKKHEIMLLDNRKISIVTTSAWNIYFIISALILINNSFCHFLVIFGFDVLRFANI